MKTHDSCQDKEGRPSPDDIEVRYPNMARWTTMGISLEGEEVEYPLLDLDNDVRAYIRDTPGLPQKLEGISLYPDNAVFVGGPLNGEVRETCGQNLFDYMVQVVNGEGDKRVLITYRYRLQRWYHSVQRRKVLIYRFRGCRRAACGYTFTLGDFRALDRLEEEP